MRKNYECWFYEVLLIGPQSGRRLHQHVRWMYDRNSWPCAVAMGQSYSEERWVATASSSVFVTFGTQFNRNWPGQTQQSNYLALLYQSIKTHLYRATSRHTNEVNERRAQWVLGWVTVFKTGKPSLYVTSHPGQLSLAIPPRVGKMSTGDDYGHRQGRNGEFCVTVGPVTRTADILTQSVIWPTWAVC